jgi:hypothetical protein
MFPFGSDAFESVEALGDVSRHTQPGKRLIRVPATQADSLLSQLGAAPEWLLLEHVPSAPVLANLRQAGHRVGMYLPSDGPHPTNRLGMPVDRSAVLERLRRLALLGAQPFVLADADAITDALHYTELVAPHAERLILLGGTREQRARVEAAFAAARLQLAARSGI